MSRIGNKIITLPEGVSVNVAEGNLVTVTGPKGTLSEPLYFNCNDNTFLSSELTL